MTATFTASMTKSQQTISIRTVSCTCHSTAPDSSHPGVPCLNERSAHLSQGCIVSGLRNGGFSGYHEERHHRQENRRHVLHSFC